MKILVIYQLNNNNDRNTISEHLYSFRKYRKDVSYHYLNVFGKMPFYIKYFKYDAVILHYTYLAGERFLENGNLWRKKIKGLTQISGYKVMIPQDEYDHTERLWEICQLAQIKEIYSCFLEPKDILLAYPPDKTLNAKVYPAFTGYVDNKATIEISNKIRPFRERPIDIGYRARKLPAYFGKHGQLKYELVELFSNELKKYDFVYDITNTNQSLTNENPNLVKLGNKWYEFLLNCKAFIGCEGGSSLLDIDGSIKARVIDFTNKNPQAEFEEIEAVCFPGKDYNISCFAISPRHFEAALCKTLQILVEGKYGNAFKPWIHYIPLKRDFSNIGEVLETLKDEKKCQQIIDNAYADIVQSNKFTYENFVSTIIESIKTNIQFDSEVDFFYKIGGKILQFRNNNYWKFEKAKNFVYYTFHRVISLVRSLIAFIAFDVLKISKNKTI